MCGIITVVSKKRSPDARLADAMLKTLRFRGPDDARTKTVGPCVLGQARLSIVDIAGGVQPMSDTRLPLTLVFNGEIYNFLELRKELENEGHTFATRSDTEVILQAYSAWGPKCVEKLDGMFAFTIWDERTQSLFIARDRFGKKPLYYTHLHDETLVLASEIKALFATGKIKGQIDPVALDAYLALMYVPPDRTIYSNIHTLPPAHYAIISYPDMTVNPIRYWSLPIEKCTDTYDEAKQKIQTLLTNAVRRRMIADVEIGSMLSGGVDSSLVSIEASTQSSKQLKTFSIGYGKHNDELPYAQKVSNLIKSDHHAFTITESAHKELRTILTYLDEPHADSSNFPQHILSQKIAEHVKVALTGDGADEFFMGYGWYWKHKHLPFLMRWYEKLFSNPFEGFMKRAQIFSPQERRNLFKDKNVQRASLIPTSIKDARVDPITKIGLWTTSVYLPGQLLSKIDRTSMLHSLELRSPFLDTALATYAFNLPFEYKCDPSKNVGKVILKDILGKYMPADFVHRRKVGFGAPMHAWLKSPEFTDLIQTYLKSPTAYIYRYLDFNTTQNELLRFSESVRGSELKVWTLLCLALWLDIHHEKIS